MCPMDHLSEFLCISDVLLCYTRLASQILRVFLFIAPALPDQLLLRSWFGGMKNVTNVTTKLQTKYQLLNDPMVESLTIRWFWV